VYICLCHGITDTQIRSCVAEGARTLCDLSSELGVATQCGNCASSACEVMREVLHAPPPSPSVSSVAPAL
jgi:bacterioferritin-associated ferredoxin